MGREHRQSPGFFAGLMYPLRGARFVFRSHRGLIRYWIVPVIVTAAAFVMLATVLARHHDELVAAVWDPVATPGIAGWLVTALHSVLDILLAIAAFAFGGVVILLGGGVVAAPFNDALSAAVERIEGTMPPEAITFAGVMSDAFRSVATELGKLVILGAVMLPLLLLNVALPAIGGPLSAVVGSLMTLGYVAIDYTDWPAARRGVGFRGRLALLRRHPRPLLGFGTGAWALLFVPGLNLLLMPAAVAGGTLLFLDLEVTQGSEASAHRPVGPTFPS